LFELGCCTGQHGERRRIGTHDQHGKRRDVGYGGGGGVGVDGIWIDMRSV
jgi:hypothetical protein